MGQLCGGSNLARYVVFSVSERARSKYIIVLTKNLFKNVNYIEASRGAGAQSVTVKPTGCEFDPTRGDEIFT